MSGRKSEDKKMNEILSLLKGAFNVLKRRERGSQIFLSAAILLIGLTLIIHLESALYLTAFTKTISLCLLMIISIGIIFYLSHSAGQKSFIEFYSDYFTQSGEKKLLSAVDLYLDPDQKNHGFMMLQSLQILRIRIRPNLKKVFFICKRNRNQ
jgi:hypothetical protein